MKYIASSNRRNEEDRVLCKKIEKLCYYSEEQVDDFPIKYWRAIDNLCPYWEKYHDLSWSYTELDKNGKPIALPLSANILAESVDAIQKADPFISLSLSVLVYEGYL